MLNSLERGVVIVMVVLGLAGVLGNYVRDFDAQLRERLERGACHGGLEFVDLRSGVNVRICNLRCTRKCC